MSSDASTKAYQKLIRMHIPLQESILECHFRMSALLDVILQIHLPNYSASALYGFLCVLSDLVDNARMMNEKLLDGLMKAGQLPDEPPQSPSGEGTPDGGGAPGGATLH